MILMDTNIVIDMLNDATNPSWNLLARNDVVLCGVVVAELYCGVKNRREEKALELLVNSLDTLPFEQADWKRLGLFIAGLKKCGLSVPFQDAVIAYLAVKHGGIILTKDRHFTLMTAADSRIRLWTGKGEQGIT